MDWANYTPASFMFSFIPRAFFFFFLEGKTPRESVFIPLVEQFKNQPFFQLKEEEKRKKKTRAEKERISAIKKTRRRTNTDSIWNVTSSRIVSHCKQKRSFRSHFLFFFFFLNGKRAGFPLVFREYGTGRCCSARRIFRSTVIFTRVVAPQWILLLPRLLTISKPLRHPWFWSAHPLLPLPPWAYHSALRLCHCSKSLYREPLHCFLFFFFFFLHSYLPIRLDSIDDRDSPIIDNHSDSVIFVESNFASSHSRDLHSRLSREKQKTFLKVTTMFCSTE